MRIYKCLLFTLFLVVSACKKDVKTTFTESDFNTEANVNVHVNIPVAAGDADIVTKINSTVKHSAIAALQIGEFQDEDINSIESAALNFTNEYKAFKTDFPDSPELWKAQIDGEVLSQSAELISVSLTSYINTGGAHGTMHISLLNFNAETGEHVENTKLFNDAEGFKKIAKTYFDNAVKDKALLDVSDSFKLPENIGFNDEGIVLLYNTFEIAPYASGIIEFMIPFDEVASYLVFNSSL
ncbi:hypothetical protein GCM10022291_10420 [Postechiella marina]|uniref:DUF3298/DUF4163 domain-containing protein n=1 Tax=Postechiella marina TaxID=943941 RepID=A0ABP8C550_9FLAO